MTDDELDRLAVLIADALQRDADAPAPSRPVPWLPAPIRPAPPDRGGEPAPWTGAGQSLGDVAPVRHPVAPRHRADVRELTAAVRGAAAGKGIPAAPVRPGRDAPSGRRARRRLPISVPIGVSNRHLHLSPEHVAILFGPAGLRSGRDLVQPGQFAALEAVAVVGPAGRIDAVRVVGPARSATQLELALSDAVALGVHPPVAASGDLAASIGGVTLVGPHGRVALERGAIVAARHLHLAPADAEQWGMQDGDRVDATCGASARAVTFHSVLVRSGKSHATELHLDADEARAAAVHTGDRADIVAWRAAAPPRRPLITEREVIRLAARGGRLPDRPLLTPGARDRARALGLLDS
jgi:putative phosphotransacetylase